MPHKPAQRHHSRHSRRHDGAGADADVLIAARRVAPNGRAIGLGMTEEMVQPALAATVPAGSSSPFNTGISR